ncbi:hypothetical protein B484DRAFT_457278 [Ochromonadaceae sp. CCMP2298]|nr:hypothetical protein B484DRAFT_457278 [Ochromonadaceae sp. CCMP2298]
MDMGMDMGISLGLGMGIDTPKNLQQLHMAQLLKFKQQMQLHQVQIQQIQQIHRGTKGQGVGGMGGMVGGGVGGMGGMGGMGALQGLISHSFVPPPFQAPSSLPIRSQGQEGEREHEEHEGQKGQEWQGQEGQEWGQGHEGRYEEGQGLSSEELLSQLQTQSYQQLQQMAHINRLQMMDLQKRIAAQGQVQMRRKPSGNRRAQVKALEQVKAQAEAEQEQEEE